MAWTWVLDDFNRSDRRLHGDNVGASSLVWQHARRKDGPVGQAEIVSNRPELTTFSQSGDSLRTDVAPLAGGASILGIGIEVLFVSKDTASAEDGLFHAGDLLLGQTESMDGTSIRIQTDGRGTGDNPNWAFYSEDNQGWAGQGPTVGMVAAGPVIPEFDILGNVQLGTFGSGSPGAWNAGDTMRAELVYGGDITLYLNGAVLATRATPAAVTGTWVGTRLDSYWNVDDIRVGVLT